MHSTPKLIDRKTGNPLHEEALAEGWLLLLYPSPSNVSFLSPWLRSFICSRTFAKFIGFYQKSILSRFAIAPFIKKFHICEKDFYLPKEGYRNFDDFFCRKLATFPQLATSDLVMPCTARYRVFTEIGNDLFQIKNDSLNLSTLLDVFDDKRFHGGTMVMARLAPADYHRVHMPLSAKKIGHAKVGELLDSVHPIATINYPSIPQTNLRHLTLFDSGGMQWVMIEVGACCIGSIVQIDPDKIDYAQGEEKSHFRFGGSLVICIFEKGKILPDQDLLELTQNHYEVLGQVGDSLASIVK